MYISSHLHRLVEYLSFIICTNFTNVDVYYINMILDNNLR